MASSWSKRIPALVVVLAGFAIASRLGLFQLGLAGPPWEPFFGDGARRVLTSSFSRALPVPDAVLGALAYAAEAVLLLIGRRDRAHTMPLVVLAYAALATLMGLTAIGLVLVQAFVEHAWCTLCLASAALSLSVVPIAWSEAATVDIRRVSSVQRLHSRRHGGHAAPRHYVPRQRRRR